MTSVFKNPALARQLFVPTVVHAVVMLVFGLLTFVLFEHTLLLDRLLLALYLVGLAAASFLYGKALGQAEDDDASYLLKRGLGSLALTLLACALLLALLDLSAAFIVGLGSLALFVYGFTFLLLGLRGEKWLPGAKDWKLTGLVGVGTAITLVLLAGVGGKVILGVTGGGALLAGIFLLVGAFSLKDEAH